VWERRPIMRKMKLVGLVTIALGMLLPSISAAEEGVTDTEIVLGSQQDLSGPAVAFGVAVKNGLEMRVREINEAGGIHGRKIKLIVEDHAYDPKKAVMLTNKMINLDKVFAFVAIFGTPAALAVLPTMTQKKIPALFPVSLSDQFHTPLNRYSFILYASYIVQGRNIAKYFVDTKKYTKFALMYQDDELGAEVQKGLTDQLALYNLKLVAAEPYKRGATDFSSQIANLKKADPQVVVLATVIRETVGALKEIRKLNWEVDVACTSASASHYVPILSQQSGFSADGTYILSSYPDPQATDLPSLKEWAKRYQEWFQKPPEMTCYPGYEAVHFFGVAAERAGRDLTREKLIDALETFKDVPTPLGGPPVSFSPTSHLGSKYYFMSQIKGGKFVKISDWISYEK